MCNGSRTWHNHGIIKMKNSSEKKSEELSYKDYLKKDREKRKPIVEQKMKEAKKTIRELKKWRKKNGLDKIKDDWYF